MACYHISKIVLPFLSPSPTPQCEWAITPIVGVHQFKQYKISVTNIAENNFTCFCDILLEGLFKLSYNKDNYLRSGAVAVRIQRLVINVKKEHCGTLYT